MSARKSTCDLPFLFLASAQDKMDVNSHNHFLKMYWFLCNVAVYYLSPYFHVFLRGAENLPETGAYEPHLNGS